MARWTSSTRTTPRIRSAGSSFVDSTIPSGFAPFNVVNIGNGKLAVTYAKQDADKHDDVPGPGNGYITIFDTSGNILSRLPHLPYLNSPWAVVVAPSSGFGGFSGDILVGQFGSGAIVAYTPAGNFVGLLFNPANLQLQIDGLWGLGFGNGSGSGPTTTLYFTAGAFDENHGILGSITCCSAGAISCQAQSRSKFASHHEEGQRALLFNLRIDVSRIAKEHLLLGLSFRFLE